MVTFPIQSSVLIYSGLSRQRAQKEACGVGSPALFPGRPLAAQLPLFGTFKQGVAGCEEGPMQVFTVDGQLASWTQHPLHTQCHGGT